MAKERRLSDLPTALKHKPVAAAVDSPVPPFGLMSEKAAGKQKMASEAVEAPAAKKAKVVEEEAKKKKPAAAASGGGGTKKLTSAGLADKKQAGLLGFFKKMEPKV